MNSMEVLVRSNGTSTYVPAFSPGNEKEAAVRLIERLLLEYSIYRRYPMRPWGAFKNACRIVFRRRLIRRALDVGEPLL